MAPCITDAIKPIEQSGTKHEKMSLVIASAREPDTGLRMRSSHKSAGMIFRLKRAHPDVIPLNNSD